MGNNWLIYSLGDLIDVKHGFAFKGEYMRDDIEHGPIVVAIGNFDYNGGFRFSETKLKRYTSDYPENFILQAGDMLLAMTCQTSGGEILGIPGIIPNDGLVYLHNQRLGKVVIKEPKLVYLEYLYWLFLSQDFNQFIFQRATGTKILHTSPTKILEYQTHLPPLAEQKNIARQLWQLQNKTILNRQINQTLEQMAQALFKSWFVDFDPVVDNALDAGFFEQDLDLPDALLRRAEVRQVVRNRPDFKPLPDATRQLFPAAFEACAEPSLGLAGWVPKGWGTCRTSDFGSIVCGKTPSKKIDEFYGYDIPFIKIPDMHGNVFLTKTEDGLSSAGSNSQIKKLLPENSVCVSCIATIGIVSITTKPAHTNQQINSIIPNKYYFRDYLYFSLLDKKKIFNDLASGGSATLNMNTGVFSKVIFLLPEEHALVEFHSRSGVFLERIKQSMKEVDVLSNLRDTLLPKLISGELQLDNIEAELATEQVN